MATIQMLGHRQEYVINLDDEDMEDILDIQLQKASTVESTIEACFHAGLVTILTHSPRKFERKCNHVKNKKSQEICKENEKNWKKILPKVLLRLLRYLTRN